MGFLIRSAFWLSLVLLAIPFGGGAADSSAEVGAIEAIGAARAAIDDVAGICERQPGVCETAGAALETIGVRAREASKIAYESLDERFGEEAGAPLYTGAIVPQPRPAEVLDPQN